MERLCQRWDDAGHGQVRYVAMLKNSRIGAFNLTGKGETTIKCMIKFILWMQVLMLRMALVSRRLRKD
jgi:hypothetical protein